MHDGWQAVTDVLGLGGQGGTLAMCARALVIYVGGVVLVRLGKHRNGRISVVARG